MHHWFSHFRQRSGTRTNFTKSQEVLPRNIRAVDGSSVRGTNPLALCLTSWGLEREDVSKEGRRDETKVRVQQAAFGTTGLLEYVCVWGGGLNYLILLIDKDRSYSNVYQVQFSGYLAITQSLLRQVWR